MLIFLIEEVSMIDKILAKDNINTLKGGGFKFGDSNFLKLFKQFYVEIHYLPQYWSDAYQDSESTSKNVNNNQTVQ